MWCARTPQSHRNRRRRQRPRKHPPPQPPQPSPTTPQAPRRSRRLRRSLTTVAAVVGHGCGCRWRRLRWSLTTVAAVVGDNCGGRWRRLRWSLTTVAAPQARPSAATGHKPSQPAACGGRNRPPAAAATGRQRRPQPPASGARNRPPAAGGKFVCGGWNAAGAACPPPPQKNRLQRRSRPTIIANTAPMPRPGFFHFWPMKSLGITPSPYRAKPPLRCSTNSIMQPMPPHPVRASAPHAAVGSTPAQPAIIPGWVTQGLFFYNFTHPKVLPSENCTCTSNRPRQRSQNRC